MSLLRSLVVVASLSASGALAQIPAPACPAPQALPSALKAWSGAAPASETLRFDHPVTVALKAQSQVKFPVAPGKTVDPAAYGAVLRWTIPAPGTYGIAAGTGVWLEVGQNGQTFRPAHFGHGPDCSGIHKIVAYTLTPGDYVVEVVNSSDASVKLMATPAE